jgi:hypothetical protein
MLPILLIQLALCQPLLPVGIEELSSEPEFIGFVQLAISASV